MCVFSLFYSGKMYLFVRHSILRQRSHTDKTTKRQEGLTSGARLLRFDSPAMSFGYGVGDVMAISRLAFKVYTACKDAPDEYGNISDEVKSLHIVIDGAAQHFKSTTLSDDKRQKGQEVLRGCQNLLEDLDSLIGKYNSLAPASTSTSTSTSQVLQRVRLGAGLVLGTEDIATLRARLTSNTTLLNGFIQRFGRLTITIIYIVLISLDSCDSEEMRARLDNILGLRLRRTTSRDSLVSLAGSVNTKKAYKKLIKDLFAIGVTADMINDKEKEIKGLFGLQQAVASNPMDDSTPGNQGPLLPEVGDSSNAEVSPISTTFGNQSQLPEAGSSSDAEASISPISKPMSRSRFSWARPPIDFLVGPRMLDAAFAGDAQLLISTLRYVRNINFTDDLGMTALHRAAGRGHRDLVELLLSKGASVDATDDFNDAPLHDAVVGGHPSIVELLLTEGASIEAKGQFKETPLHKAAAKGHTNIVELLLTKGASIEARCSRNYTPLRFATSHGHRDSVKLLENKAAELGINIRTISG